MSVNKEVLNKQQQHWESIYTENLEMFGAVPSEAAHKAVEILAKEGAVKILELGGGQGRDTSFFAHKGYHISVLDYSSVAIRAITNKVQSLGLSDSVSPMQHDAREKLPFDDGTFDACFSHMFFNMALTAKEQEFIHAEIMRVIKPNALNIYTSRNNFDPQYGEGIHVGEDIFNVNGIAIHFLSEERINLLAKNYVVERLERLEETDLPKRLFFVVVRKSG